MRQEQILRRALAVLAALLLLAAIASGLWMIVAGFGNAMGCADKELRRTDSPSGTLSVIEFARSCGVTAPDTRQFSIHAAGRELDSEAFPPFLVIDAEAVANVEWVGARRLAIRLGGGEKVYRSEIESKGVAIDYVR